MFIALHRFIINSTYTLLEYLSIRRSIRFTFSLFFHHPHTFQERIGSLLLRILFRRSRATSRYSEYVTRHCTSRGSLCRPQKAVNFLVPVANCQRIVSLRLEWLPPSISPSPWSPLSRTRSAEDYHFELVW